jgi:hypothetical protein
MHLPVQSQADAGADSPLDAFSRCHAGILAQLEATGELPALVDAARRSRELAAATVELFEHAVLPHHAEEEAELFPAVLQSARPDEAEGVRLLVAQLTAEHRAIETQWKQLRPALKAAAQGQRTHVGADAIGALLEAYRQHARTEERRFLPLAQGILGRDGNHMAALALALHLRHAPLVIGYI